MMWNEGKYWVSAFHTQIYLWLLWLLLHVVAGGGVGRSILPWLLLLLLLLLSSINDSNSFESSSTYSPFCNVLSLQAFSHYPQHFLSLSLFLPLSLSHNPPPPFVVVVVVIGLLLLLLRSFAGNLDLPWILPPTHLPPTNNLGTFRKELLLLLLLFLSVFWLVCLFVVVVVVFSFFFCCLLLILVKEKSKKGYESSIQLPTLEERTGHSFCPVRELGEEQRTRTRTRGRRRTRHSFCPVRGLGRRRRRRRRKVACIFVLLWRRTLDVTMVMW